MALDQKTLEKKRAWNRRNRDKIRAKSKEWRDRNPEKMRAYKRRYYELHREEQNARARLYYAKHKEKLQAQERERHRLNRDALLARKRADRAKNPEKYRTWHRRHKEANPVAWRLYSARKQAKAKGVEFDLDLEWFKSLLAKGICELSGLPFDLREKPSVGGRGPNSPSVDRRDPRGPYTKANCRLILWWLNRAMIDLGEEYAMRVFRGIFIKRGEMLGYEDRMAA
jgi:hypothetical protein